MSFLPFKDDKIALRFNIIKQGLITEKQKSSKLQLENLALKEDLQIHKELLEKLQHELNQIKSTSQKSQKSLFNVLFQAIGDNEEDESTNPTDTQISALSQENADLKSQIEILIKEKQFITFKLNELKKEYEESKKTSTAEIERLKQCYTNNGNDENHYTERIITMSAVIIRQDKEKIETEKLIEFYEKDQNDKIKNIAILYEEQNVLIDEIEELTIENKQLKRDNEEYIEMIDSRIPITKKTVFKGRRVTSKEPMLNKEIYVTFGAKTNCITIRELCEKDIEVSMSNVSEMRCVETNKISFIVYNQGTEIKYLIEFRPKQIDYIRKYYEEAKDNIDFLADTLWKYSYDPCFYA